MSRSILVMGQPHCGKTEMANAIIAELVASGVTAAYLNGNQLRQHANDFDYMSIAGQCRQIERIKQRMAELAVDVVVVDLMQSARRARYDLAPAILVWVGDIDVAAIDPLNEIDIVVKTPNDVIVQSKAAVTEYIELIEKHRLENQANLDFINRNKWLISSPGRCGGTLIGDIIKSMYARMGVPMSVHIPYIAPNTKINLEPNSLVHTHNLPQIDALAKLATSHLILTRDMVDATISQSISLETNVWHQINHYKNSKFIDNTTHIDTPGPVHLDIDLLLHRHNKRIKFYVHMARHITPRTQIIDYSEFGSNMHNIPSILGFTYDTPLDAVRLPIKNASFKDRVINYDEVCDAVSNLARNPAEICSAYAI